jgi:hypothetical protein
VALGEIGRIYHGRYRIDRELWQAPPLLSLLVTDLRNGRPCVLRRLFVATAAPEDVKRFEAQIAIFARLDHAGLPRFIEGFVDEESGDRVLVTSYHPGESLERLVAKGRPLTEPQAIALMRRIVPVLAYLHGFDPPLVHRAIKPTGIVVGPDGRPCITAIDFVVPELEVPAAEQGPPGPDDLARAAPEVLTGRPVPASDVYALGLVIIRGMTAVKPAELLREGVKPRLRDALGVSEAFAAMIAQMLDPSLERRYPDAQALEADLAKLAGVRVAGAQQPPQTGAAPQPASPPSQQPAEPPVQQPAEAAAASPPRRTARPLIYAGLALALAALVAVAVRLRQPPSPGPDLLVPQTAEPQRQTAETKAPAEAPPPELPAAVQPAPEAPQPPASTEQPAASVPGDVAFEGRLLFDGKPFTSAAAPKPVFWFRNESTKVVEKPDVNVADGIFRVRGLPPGRYGVGVRIDLDPSNPNLYPGDLSAWSEATLEAGRPAAADFTLRKHLRLKQPVDNGFAIPGWDVPCGAGQTIPGQVVFAWEPIDVAATYDVRIDRLACDRGYSAAGSVLSRSTTDTWVKVELPPNNAGECYSLRLNARKDGRTVGILATHGTTGLGWDYRFSVAP